MNVCTGFPFGLLIEELQLYTLDLFMDTRWDQFRSCWTTTREVPSYTPQWLLHMACVNTVFYKYFMSDRIWLPFDVYGIKNNIARHYLEMASAMSTRERRELICKNTMGYPDWTDSLYTQLNVLQHNFFRWEDGPHILNKQLLTCLIFNNPPVRLKFLPSKETLLRIVARNPFIISAYSECEICVGTQVCNDFDIMFAAVSNCGCMLEYASAKLRENRAIVSAAVASCGRALEMSLGFRHDRALNLAAIMHPHQCCELKSLAPEFRDDKALVLKAVTNGGFQLGDASSRLKSDKQVVRQAILDDPDAFQFASHDLKNDITLTLLALEEDWSAAKYVGEQLKQDPSFVAGVVARYPEAIIYFVDQSRYQTEPELILLCLEHNPAAIEWLPKDLACDKSFMLQAISHCPEVIMLASPELRANVDIAEAACLCNPLAYLNLEYVSLNLRANKLFMLKAVGLKGQALEYASDELLIDVDLIILAVTSDINALPPASRALLADFDFALDVAEAICAYDDFFWRSYMHKWCNNKTIVWSLVRRWPEAFMFTGRYLCDDEFLLLTALSGQWSSKFLNIWRHASERLRNSKRIMLAAYAVQGRRFVLNLDFLADKQMVDSLDELQDHELGPGAVDLWKSRLKDFGVD